MRSFLVASSCAALIFVGAGVLPASVALASDTPDVEDPHAKGAHGGSASGEDVERLGETVRKRVEATSGIALQWEIIRLGEPREGHAVGPALALDADEG